MVRNVARRTVPGAEGRGGIFGVAHPWRQGTIAAAGTGVAKQGLRMSVWREHSGREEGAAGKVGKTAGG